jgi:hypothetical protein
VTTGAFRIDDLPERADALLQRALWLCGQVPRLHELSEQLGVASHVMDIANCQTTRGAQIIIEAADRLQHELSQYLDAVHPAPKAKVIQLRLRRKFHKGNHDEDAV